MRILLSSVFSPLPQNSGGRQRTDLIFRSLSELGEVDLFLINEPVDADSSMLSRLQSEYRLQGIGRGLNRGAHLPWKLFRAAAPRFVDRLAHNLGSRAVEFMPDRLIQQQIQQAVRLEEYDVLVCVSIRAMTAPGFLGDRRTILDVDNVPSSLYRTRLDAPHTSRLARPIVKRHMQQLEKLEGTMVEQAGEVWLCKEEDKATGPAFARARVLPNICWHKPGQEPQHLASQANSLEVISVASMDYPPNVQGIRTFCEEIWPRVLDKVPGAVFRIIGSGLRDELKRELSRPGVDPVGFVDSLEAAYQASAFSVAPIYHGGGTNIKVIESLAYGRTCVISQAAQRGYETTFPNGKALLVGRDFEEYAAHCIRLLSEPAYREGLAKTGYTAVQEHHSWRRFNAVVRETVEALLGRTP